MRRATAARGGAREREEPGRRVDRLECRGVTVRMPSWNYLCGNTWFQPSFGANGVYYRVVPTP
jgi:hypothetical protein